MCVCVQRKGAGSPRAQCKVIREAFHDHREGILGMRDGVTREGGSLENKTAHIFISIPVFIVSLRGGGRGGVASVMTFSLIAWERRRQRERLCFSMRVWCVRARVCMCVWTKEGELFSSMHAYVRVRACACVSTLFWMHSLRESHVCRMCQRGWNPTGCIKSVWLKHSVLCVQREGKRDRT